MIPATSSPRLAVVLSHPTQYYSPWFRWLAAHAPVSLRVFFLWDFGVTAKRDPRFQQVVTWDVDLLSGYESEFVPNESATPGPENFRGFNNPELLPRLEQWRPDAVLLFGYRYLSHLRVIRWATPRRIPLIFRGDSHRLGRGKPGLLRATPLRWLFRQFAAVTYVGAANRDYFRTLGVPEDRLFFAPHAVDNTLFDPSRPEHRDAAAALRSRLGIGPGTRVVLFAGKFVPAKQPCELLEAFLEVRPTGTALLFVGDGPAKPALQALAPGAGDSSVVRGPSSVVRGPSIHFLPFANQSEMPARYAAADVFTLPSRGHYETWGLAVNEAMHMGLPCLVSDRVGCQRDLVTDGETGWVFRSDDPADLRAKLAAASTADLQPFRTRVADRISGYTYREASAGLIRALAACRT